MQSLRVIQRLLDSAFVVPGTQVRVGWDPIIGLIPWVGDVVTAVVACAIVMQAHQMRAPRVVQARMLFNVGIDLLIGSLPVAGDIADVFWRANSRNMALLERHTAVSRHATAGDWAFVGIVLVAVVGMALMPLVLLYLLARAI